MTRTDGFLTWGLLAAAAVLACSFTPVWAADLSPDELAAQVLIRRDTYGVPHILADTEEAAAFGYGYAAAEDHVLEIARLYLAARAEEAAYFGEQFAESDFMMKQFRIWEVAAEGYGKSPPAVRSVLDGYAAGYNRYLDKHRSELPDWVKPVTGIDVLSHGRRDLILGFCMNLGQIARIGRTASAKRVEEDPAEMQGSNMWAIGKERSASGNALLLGNPHLGWAGAMLWHEVHTTVPGKVNFMGATLIGLPGGGIGFNEHLGWSHTVNPHDCDDIYELTLDPADGHRYLYEGKSLAMDRYEISIKVKGSDGAVTEITREMFWSHYGPVVRFLGDKAYAFKSANIDEYRMLEQGALMSRAKNLDEFRRALDMQAHTMFNIAYADDQGNCFYIFNGRFPDRPRGYDWSGIVPGNTTATEWNHILPESRLPFLVNPPGGYVQNSNSAPWYTNLNAIIDRRNYPPYLSPNGNSLRTQLGLEMIEGDDSISLEEILEYKYNMKLLLADRVKGDLLNIARGRVVNGIDLDEAVAILEKWDNSVGRDSVGAVLFDTFWQEYRAKAKPVYAVAWDERHPASTPHGIGDGETALHALSRAVWAMEEAYGALDVPWGEVHRLRRGDIDVPIGGYTGNFGAFRVIGYRRDDDGKMVAAGGDSYVFAVEFSSPIRAYSILAYSQSDDPKSPHHTDQSVLFAKEQWKPMWFSEDDIAKHTERSYRP